jgi:hypothetical protein
LHSRWRRPALEPAQPVFTTHAVHYTLAQRARGLAYGGLGAIHALVQRLGLPAAINEQLHLLRSHRPYHESDHVLSFAYNALCEGACLQDLELLRQDEVCLDLLGTDRLPDPTTAGDFCRRFTPPALRTLEDVFHQTRQKVWRQQPDAFFAQAILDADGTFVPTTGECKEGMDISYDGTWGYHPLVISLANTGEVLCLRNRPANRPSQEGAAAELDRCIQVCLHGGFRSVLLRGDTDFSQTQHLDRWYQDGRIPFIFGFDALPNLKEMAEELPACAWQPLTRPPRYQVQTQPRQRPQNVKDQVVRQREFETLRLQSEDVAEFLYKPSACRYSYRMVIVRKNISRTQGEARLFDEVRYFFYLTNDLQRSPEEIVFLANDRCDQENLHAQLKHGCRALTAPVDALVSNNAYMLMTALAWNLKAWWALSLSMSPRWRERHQQQQGWLLKIEFKTFVHALVRIPCQLVKTGRQLVLKVLHWNPHLGLFFRLVDALRC